MANALAAKKLRVASLLAGHARPATEKEGAGWMLATGEDVQRAHLVGTIVSAAEDNKSFLLDDGTGRMLLRVFDRRFARAVPVGSMVRAIGRPREFGEPYLALELLRVIDDLRWAELHRLECEEPAPAQQNKGREQLLQLIHSLDAGGGAQYEDLARQFAGDLDAHLHILLGNGEVFETAPGKLKVLE